MSLDLTLLPYNSPLNESVHFFSHTLLPLQANCRDLMEAIQQLSWKDYPNSVDFITEGLKATGNVEKGFTCFLAKDKEGEYSYGEVTKDGYSEQMRWVRVSELLKFNNHPSVEGNPKNKAAWGYLKACPPNQKVALYWS